MHTNAHISFHTTGFGGGGGKINLVVEGPDCCCCRWRESSVVTVAAITGVVSVSDGAVCDSNTSVHVACNSSISLLGVCGLSFWLAEAIHTFFRGIGHFRGSGPGPGIFLYTMCIDRGTHNVISL